MGAMSEGPVLTINDLPDEIRLNDAYGIKHRDTVAQAEQSAPHPDDIDESMVREALVRCKNRKTRAAEHLGISRTTLWRLIKRFNLSE
jgi:transcriptional regulator of acetoin/glycerol metabolism